MTNSKRSEKKSILQSKIFWVILIFVFSVLLRLWNINSMGRTTDEAAQAVDGYDYLQLIRNGDFNNKYLYDHPYHPPLSKYLYGLTMYTAISDPHPTKHPILLTGEPTFQYDWTSARLLSVIISSLSVILVTLIGWEYISATVGIIAGIIFAMLPFFLSLSQLASIESVLMLTFTASVYAFLKLLEKLSWKNIILTGVLFGLAMGTKYTNILLIPIFLSVYILWYIYVGKRKQSIWNPRILSIFPIAFLVYFLLWPMPWFHLKEVIAQNYQLRIKETGLPVPEVFLGRLILVPKEYHVVYFLITTPLLILALFFYGLKHIYDFRFSKNNLPRSKLIFYSLVVWFTIPFIQSLYNFRQHGVRYIIEIYAPLALISAIGFESFISLFFKSFRIKLLFFIPVVIYLFLTLLSISPYYLDYFNGLVGGPKKVYEKKLFQMGWWGQGLREASLYIEKNAPKGSQVGLAVEPASSVMPQENIHFSTYTDRKRYDYVVVSYYAIVREGFDDSSVKKNYKPVYNVLANGAALVTVYKHK